MRYLVRCRGGEWLLGRFNERFAIHRVEDRWFARLRRANARGIDLYWNGLPQGGTRQSLRNSWGERPAWLFVAWLCCEFDPAEGPGFAAAILDAEPGDDFPAMVACDWLEERGAMGRSVRPNYPASAVRHFEAHYQGLGWSSQVDFGPAPHDGPTADIITQGPLAPWCRFVIDIHCMSCGGWRNGENKIRLEITDGNWIECPRNLVEREIEARSRPSHPEGTKFIIDRCPLCGFPTPPTPQPLVIVDVVKPAAPP